MLHLLYPTAHKNNNGDNNNKNNHNNHNSDTIPRKLLFIGGVCLFNGVPTPSPLYLSNWVNPANLARRYSLVIVAIIAWLPL